MLKLISCLLLVSSATAFALNPPELFAVEEKDVTFRLYTRQNPERLDIVTGALDGTTFDSTKPFIFITHGYTDAADADWVSNIRKELLDKDDYNVIAVDWSGPASSVDYNICARNTRIVGKFIALLLIDLNENHSVPYKNIHLVGHSLGSHVSGFAGKYIIDNKQTKIGRITGMDPAGPSFLTSAEPDRLSAHDAIFVDAIHTDNQKYGFRKRIAQVDFFPNGGYRQPGCWMYDGSWVSCSHSRSYYLFTESIKSEKFIATACSSIENYKRGKCNGNPTAVMGFNVDLSLDGEYYLTTNGKSPYAKNGAI